MTTSALRALGVERLATALTTITREVESRLAGSPSNTRLCGVCGCLCLAVEACPKCRGDLVGR